MRLDHQQDRKLDIISKADFTKDWAKGYAVTVFLEERKEEIRDPYSGRVHINTIPRIVHYCCMRCKYKIVEEEHMKQHQFRGEHIWQFTPFENPYGHIDWVQIEGIETVDQTYIQHLKEIEL